MMPTGPREPVVLIATGNPGKFREIVAELAGAPARFLSLRDVPPIEPCEETGETFEANAREKAVYYARRSGRLALADDSGLEVDALAGRPGVLSARYAGRPCDDAANNRKLVEELHGVPAERRTARFRCAMALADPSGRILAETAGAIEGVIIDSPRGKNGFGYDPHFLVPALGRTTAELDPAHKNRISHRGQATRAMGDALRRLLADRT